MSASALFPKPSADWSAQVLAGTTPVRIWHNSKTTTNKALFIVHGWGEQSDRYEHFTHYLNGVVDWICAVDLPGHGLTPGIRGHFDHFDLVTVQAVRGFELFQHHMKSHGASEVQIHWLGHSFGGLTTLKVMKSLAPKAVKSFIVSAPLLGFKLPIPKLKVFFGKLITPILPRFPLSQELDGSTLSRDPSVGIAYKQNPLNHSQITPKAFEQMTLAMSEMSDWKGPLPAPTIFFVPLADQIVDPQKTLTLTQNLKQHQSPATKSLFLPGMSHESFNDLEKNLVFNALATWLN